MRESIRKAWTQDKGAALAIVATSLFLLMGVAAISADLAWYYLNASRVQRTADAAALAGVVYLPHETGTASTTAIDIANRNGYDNSLADVSVIPAVIGENQLQVSVSDDVDTFFAKVLGWDTMTVSRSAVAEFIPPLKLGSPDNQFGDSCKPGVAGCTSPNNFWANIHGKWTQTSYGDAYASFCDPGNAFNCGSLNPNRRAAGYLYGIESNSSFTVQFTDLAFHNQSGGVGTSDGHRTGDRGCEDGSWGGGATTAADCGPTMRVNLYAPDPTPLDVSNNTLLCTATVPPRPQVAANAPYVWETPDGQGCWTQSGTGVYIVQVMHVDPGPNNHRSGLNRYSVRSTTGNLFGLGDFSLYNNVPGSTSSFYLAEVPTYYHGKTFVVEMYDPGEFTGAGNARLQMIDPGSTTPFNSGVCRIYSRNNPSNPWSLQQTIAAGGNCEELVHAGEYDRRWLKIEIDLPPEYACASDCWWRVNYIYPTGNVQDTTTWRAYMIGNPIHIID